MADETDIAMPDNPDPTEKLRQAVIKCAERQQGYDIADRVKTAPQPLLERMKNCTLDRMRAHLEEWCL